MYLVLIADSLPLDIQHIKYESNVLHGHYAYISQGLMSFTEIHLLIWMHETGISQHWISQLLKGSQFSEIIIK